jgi:hypothetical protein
VSKTNTSTRSVSNVRCVATPWPKVDSSPKTVLIIVRPIISAILVRNVRPARITSRGRWSPLWARLTTRNASRAIGVGNRRPTKKLPTREKRYSARNVFRFRLGTGLLKLAQRLIMPMVRLRSINQFCCK